MDSHDQGMMEEQAEPAINQPAPHGQDPSSVAELRRVDAGATSTPHQRRKRYAGKNPRRFEDKYKEHGADAETLAKVVAAGKTPAGTHRPIMVAEILEVLAPRPGDVAADCTLGYGGHARELLAKILPGGRLLGLDADPVELPKTEARLRALGFDESVFTAQRSNFAGLPQALAAQNLSGADVILADLGVSSMQIDDPARGFSVKFDGPLDMRMNPLRGQPASAVLQSIQPDALADLLAAGADEPHAAELARRAGRKIFCHHPATGPSRPRGPAAPGPGGFRPDGAPRFSGRAHRGER